MSETLAPAVLQIADVAIDARAGGSDAVYTYLAPFSVSVGDAVLVPLGNRTALGFVRNCGSTSEEELGYPIEKLKPLAERVDGLSLPPILMELVEFASKEYLCPFTVSLAAATPPGAADRLVETWSAADSEFEISELSAMQRETLEALRMSGPFQRSEKKKLESAVMKSLRLLAAKGLVERRTTFAPPTEKKEGPPLYRPVADTAQIEAFLKAHAKKRPAQALTLLRLQEIDSAALAISDIKSLCGVTEATVKQLITAGLLQSVDASAKTIGKAPTPNAQQSIAIDAIVDSVQSSESKSFLLFGVTGSGKTEVYLRAAAEAMRMGRQVLYLTPEIALATQAVKLLRERFGRSVAILHSDLSPTERASNWSAIRSGEAAIVLGARSALFAPMRDLGLIILDEEHESSYKQESSPRYHAKRLAQFLSERHGCPLVLGSATPSFESFYEAEQEKHVLLSLPSRAAAATMPTVFVEDLGEGYRNQKPAIFSELLADKMAAALEKNEQIILFLNRRSYAPFLICRDCGQQFMCPNCSVSLTFSRKMGRLRCHHCGYTTLPPDSCPACDGIRINPFGVGTEKVEEQVAAMFPEAKVTRLDRDVTQRKGALEQVLAEFGSGEIDILVGTQMVAKGLNFPGVTLVGVIAADMSLNLPDFRAAERTYQLLSQVAGRSGRGSKPGEVVIQTFNPEHVSILAARDHQFLQAYEALIGEREEADYPPFKRIVNIVLSGPVLQTVQESARALADGLKHLEAADLTILGPTDCAIERLNKNWRMHALIKAPTEFDVARLEEPIEAAKKQGVQIVADVDPYSMM